jgi:cell division protein FtsW (lipid II flippase)
VNGVGPRGLLRRAVEAIGAILLVAFVARWAYDLLKPLLPALVVLLVLALVFSMLFGRRR